MSHSALYTNALRIIFPILARLLNIIEFYATLLYPKYITDKSKVGKLLDLNSKDYFER